MNVINFEYPEQMTNELDKLNAQMYFIVNRACAFSLENFDGIVIPYLNEFKADSYLLYNTVRIISMVKGIPFYVPKKHKNIEWVDKENINCTFKWKWQLNKMLKDNKKIRYDISCEDNILHPPVYPRLFYGFTYEMIREIAEKLYDFRDFSELGREDPQWDTIRGGGI